MDRFRAGVPDPARPDLIEGVGNDVLLIWTVLVGLVSAAFLVVRGLNVAYGDAAVTSADVMTAPRVTPVARADRGVNGADRGTSDAQGSSVRRGDEMLCAICLARLSLPLETNCGHVFCAQCLIAYREHAQTLGAMRCPMCRQRVTLLLPVFSETELSSSADTSLLTARENARAQVALYNRRYSGEPRPLLDYLRDVPTLLRHLWREFFSVGGLVLMFRVRVVLCFLLAVCYLLSPFDILPEMFLGLFGLLDDLFIVLLVVIYVSVIYRQYVIGRQ